MNNVTSDPVSLKFWQGRLSVGTCWTINFNRVGWNSQPLNCDDYDLNARNYIPIRYNKRLIEINSQQPVESTINTKTTSPLNLQDSSLVKSESDEREKIRMFGVRSVEAKVIHYSVVIWSQLTDVWNTVIQAGSSFSSVYLPSVFFDLLYRVPGQIHFETDRRVFDVYFQFFLSVILHCQFKRGICFKVHSYLQVWIRWFLYV